MKTKEWGNSLYLIQTAVTGAFKVGRSSNPKRRLQDLQVGSPYKLKIILVIEGAGYREPLVHKSLAGYRSQGVMKGEWFIEPGMSSLPEDIYEMLDLEMVNTWWETSRGPIDLPGPPGPGR